MAFACAQGGIRCSCQLSWLNSKVSADLTARLLSSAEPFHTQVDHRPFNGSTHDSHSSSNSFRVISSVAHLLSRISVCQVLSSSARNWPRKWNKEPSGDGATGLRPCASRV